MVLRVGRGLNVQNVPETPVRPEEVYCESRGASCTARRERRILILRLERSAVIRRIDVSLLELVVAIGTHVRHVQRR